MNSKQCNTLGSNWIRRSAAYGATTLAQIANRLRQRGLTVEEALQRAGTALNGTESPG